MIAEVRRASPLFSPSVMDVSVIVALPAIEPELSSAAIVMASDPTSIPRCIASVPGWDTLAMSVSRLCESLALGFRQRKRYGEGEQQESANDDHGAREVDRLTQKEAYR